MDPQQISNDCEMKIKPKPCFLCRNSYGSIEALYLHFEEEHGIFVQELPMPKPKTPVKKKSIRDAWIVTDNICDDDGYGSFKPNHNSTLV